MSSWAHRLAVAATTRTSHLARTTAIAVLKWLRTLPTAGANFGRFLWWTILAGIISKRMRLFVALSLFIGWLSYLGYAALTKSHSPIVSHAQAAAADIAVVAEVEKGEDGKPSMSAKVVKNLSPNGPRPDTVLFVANLPDVRGFEGPGQYLLLLFPDLPPYYVVGQLRSPGNDLTGVGKPAIYHWNEEVRMQYEKMHR